MTAETIERELYTLNEFCRRNSIGRTTAYALVKQGAVLAVKIGVRTFVTAASERAWRGQLEVLAANPEPPSLRQLRPIEYATWTNMMQRCANSKREDFKYYGGRGIKVCGRWHKFEEFFADMGSRPTQAHSIDRVNNDGDYEPGNCRWATAREQRANRRNPAHVLTHTLLLNSTE